MCSTVTWTSFFSPHCLTHVLSNQSSYAGTKCTHWMIDRLPLRGLFLYFIGPANENGPAAPQPPPAPAPRARARPPRSLLQQVAPAEFPFIPRHVLLLPSGTLRL